MKTQKNIPQTQPAKTEVIEILQEFRQKLHDFFGLRADATMDLIDALASNDNARSVVELSLSLLFPRAYGSVYDAIHNFFVPSSAEKKEEEQREHEQDIVRLIAPYIPLQQQRKYYLFGTDVTYLSRRFAYTLGDRTYVHSPNAVAGNKPITIGHDYSLLNYLPEKFGTSAPPWAIPLIVRRVKSSEKAGEVGAEQIEAIMEDETLPFYGKLCVVVEDGSYSGREHLASVAPIDNLVSIIHFPSNRVVYRKYEPSEDEKPPVGHPQWYGHRFDLKDPDTWLEPDEKEKMEVETPKGEIHTIYLEGWHNMVRKGTQEIPMHKYPFTLVRVHVVDADGEPVYKNDTWLIVIGERRDELSLVEIQESYEQRSDVEHLHRFEKQNLLMDEYQTPEVEHEENWWQIVQLAYFLLWLARPLAEVHRRAWERYLPQPEAGNPSPSIVQRDLERIILRLGTPSRPPKPRGYSPGRAKGAKPPHRKRQPVIKKS